jgi:hypothetical protein
VIINASIGHDLGALSAQAKASCPNATVVGASCAGVVGREGVSESINDVAVMAVRGRDFVLSHVDGLCGDNGYEKGLAGRRAPARQQTGEHGVPDAPGTMPATASSRPSKSAWARATLRRHQRRQHARGSDLPGCGRQVYQHAALPSVFATPRWRSSRRHAVSAVGDRWS